MSSTISGYITTRYRLNRRGIVDWRDRNSFLDKHLGMCFFRTFYFFLKNFRSGTDLAERASASRAIPMVGAEPDPGGRRELESFSNSWKAEVTSSFRHAQVRASKRPTPKSICRARAIPITLARWVPRLDRSYERRQQPCTNSSLL